MPKFLKSVSKGLLCALGVIFLFSCALGAVQLFLNISDSVLKLLSVSILAAASYYAGCAATKICRTRGLIQGLLCGGAIFLLAAIISAALGLFDFEDVAPIKAIVCLVFGGIGGVRGVNAKLTGERH